MSDDYLWDGSGPPDPDVRKLEALLQEARYRPAPMKAPPVARWRRLRPLAAAAALVLVLGGLGAYVATRPPPTSFAVKRYQGPEAAAGAPTSRLYVGSWLETDGASRAEIAVADIGRVQVAPSSRVRLLGSKPTEHRLQLARGEIHAHISAPPRLFIVDTPSGEAVDLGCEYTLRVTDQGASILHVSLGYVALEGSGKSSTVPAGAYCETRPGTGPGTPYDEDASEALRQALARLDFEGEVGALDAVLAAARPEDALTLWHLLSRVDTEHRKAVYNRLSALAPPPAEVNEKKVLELDKPVLDSWWEAIADQR